MAPLKLSPCAHNFLGSTETGGVQNREMIKYRDHGREKMTHNMINFTEPNTLKLFFIFSRLTTIIYKKRCVYDTQVKAREKSQVFYVISIFSVYCSLEGSMGKLSEMMISLNYLLRQLVRLKSSLRKRCRGLR